MTKIRFIGKSDSNFENGEIYQKEKEKNKNLAETSRKLYEIGKEIEKQNIYTSENYISKDKIREKIKKLENKIHIVIPNKYNKIEMINEFKTEGAINALQELLGESNENIN